MFALLVLVGHIAQLARKLSRGPTISSHVLLYLRFLPLYRVPTLIYTPLFD
jgi:hypothetical protein